MTGGTKWMSWTNDGTEQTEKLNKWRKWTTEKIQTKELIHKETERKKK